MREECNLLATHPRDGVQGVCVCGGWGGVGVRGGLRALTSFPPLIPGAAGSRARLSADCLDLSSLSFAHQSLR